MSQTGEVPTKRKNKAYAVIKNEMEERERAKKRVSKNMVRFNQKYGSFQQKKWFVSIEFLCCIGIVWVPPLKCCVVDRLPLQLEREGKICPD